MSSHHRPLDAAALQRLLIDTHPWLSCDDCLARLDAHAEATLDGRPADRAMLAHLAGCPACAEEAESLTELLRDDAQRGRRRNGTSQRQQVLEDAGY